MIEPKIAAKLKAFPSQISKATFIALLPCAALGGVILLVLGLLAEDVSNTGIIWYSIIALPGVAIITGIVHLISVAKIKQEFFNEPDDVLSQFYAQLLQIRDEHRDQAEKGVSLYRQIVKSLKEVKQPEIVKTDLLQSIESLTMMLIEQTQNVQNLEDKIAAYSLEEMQNQLRQNPENHRMKENIENYQNIRAHTEKLQEQIDRAVQSIDNAYLNLLNSPERLNRNIEEVNNRINGLEISSSVYDEVRSLELL